MLNANELATRNGRGLIPMTTVPMACRSLLQNPSPMFAQFLPVQPSNKADLHDFCRGVDP